MVAQHFDGVVKGEERRCHPIENRRRLWPFYPDRLKFADMSFERVRLTTGPAGDDQLPNAAQIERFTRELKRLQFCPPLACPMLRRPPPR